MSRLLLFMLVSAAYAGPAITGVQNNYNSVSAGIAPGSLFVISGTGLASASEPVLQSSAVGLPLTLNGASISVTVNGVTTNPGIYYATANGIAAVLPSNTPVGVGTVTVLYNGAASDSASITVLKTALGFDTLSGVGVGLGVATDAVNGRLISYTQSAIPGETIVLWGSGLGASVDSDTTFTSTPHAVGASLGLYIGGLSTPVIYAGGSGYPGVNQINVTIPKEVSTGCGVSIVAVSKTVVSNTITIPISAGGGVCSDPVLGIDGSQTVSKIVNLSVLKSNGGVYAGMIAVQESANSAQDGIGVTSLNSCTMQLSAAQAALFTSTTLDAGTVNVMALGSTQLLPGQVPNSFFPDGGGTFTFSGSGGKDVGAFTATVSYANPFTWTNQNALATIDRTQGASVTWTGGAADSYVIISGGSSAGGFFCYAPASAGQFFVPPAVLLGLPATSGTLDVLNASRVQTFSATGIERGTVQAGVSMSGAVVYR